MSKPKIKNLVRICAWCPDKESKENEAISNGFSVTHWLCKKCAKLYFS